MPENEDAERIYFVVCDQYIMSQGGPMSLNQVAIHEAMRLYKVVDKKGCFEKVVSLGRHIIAKEAEKAEEARKRN